MTVPGINTVCYVGAGTMGCYNSLAAAISGYDVVLQDVNPETLAGVGQRHQEFAAMLVGGGYCGQDAIPAALARVTIQPDLAQAVADADLVSESVFERLDIKRDVHAKLDSMCSPRTLITTNSSILQVSQIEDVLQHGERFAALHSHLGSPLVDIVPGPRTDAACVELLRRYVLSISGVPLVLKKEYPGYVLNAMLGPVLSVAQSLVLDGGATVEDVDRAWMTSRSAVMGPFGMIDLFGINLIHDTWEQQERSHYLPALREQALDFLGSYMKQGHLGMKSGRGFYRYPEPAYQRPEFLSEARGLEDLAAALEVALIGNAVLIAAAGVADAEQVDQAWQAGTYLNSGPFEILSSMGFEAFSRMLSREVAGARFSDVAAARVKDYLETEFARTGGFHHV